MERVIKDSSRKNKYNIDTRKEGSIKDKPFAKETLLTGQSQIKRRPQVETYSQ